MLELWNDSGVMAGIQLKYVVRLGYSSLLQTLPGGWKN